MHETNILRLLKTQDEVDAFDKACNNSSIPNGEYIASLLSIWNTATSYAKIAAIEEFVKLIEEQEFNTDTLCTDCSNGYTLKRLVADIKSKMLDDKNNEEV